VAEGSSKQERRVRLTLAGVAFLVSLVTIIWSVLPVGRRLENAAYDTWFNLRGTIERPEEIVLVAIDIESEESLGRYPWERTHHATLIRNLARAGVKVVAFDATFADVFPDQDPILRRAIEETGIVILGAKTAVNIRSQAVTVRLEEPAPELRDAAPYGIVDIHPDVVDQVVREYPIAHYYQRGTLQVPQLGVQALKMYLGIPLSDTVAVTPRGWRLGEIDIPRGPSGNMLISYTGLRGHITTYSYVSIVDDAETDIGDWDFDAFEDLLAEDRLRGKMAFVGSTVPEHQDLRATPFAAEEGTAGAILTPGVEIHANAVDTILKQRFIRATSPGFDLLLIILAGILVTLLTARLRARAGGVAGLGIVAVLLAAGWICFRAFSLWVPVISPVIAAVLAYSGSTVALYLAEQQEKKRIRGMFQQYVAPSVVSELLAHPELLDLGGEEREATVLFCDIAGFTNISEGLSPTELVRLLNDYLTDMTEIVYQFNGIIDKYQGDAMMAEFGVPVPHPDHALQSCLAAIEMQRRLTDMRQIWKEEGRPELHSRIGINTGPMLVGNLGSNHIMDYTVMGDNVNLASRLEGVNKVYGTIICISESTYDQLQGELICRELDLIRVKGKQQPVRIFEVLETVDHGIPGGRYSMLERYEMALMFYRDQRFPDALELFTELHEIDPDDGPTRVGKMRCEAYVENPPPPDWDGVFTMTTK